MSTCHPASPKVTEYFDSSEEVSNNFNVNSIENPDVAMFILYIRRIKLETILSRVTDLRKNSTYPLHSILLVAFSTVLFRSESKHSFHTEASCNEETQKKVAQFCGCPNKQFPNVKTIDDALSKLSIDEMNGVLMDLFEQIRLSKLFSQHSTHLLPKGMYPNFPEIFATRLDS